MIWFGNCQIAVRLGPKITETVKGKLRFGARVLQIGGIEKVFKKLFKLEEEERLLKAFQCYLSTTSGPLAGILFTSTHKIAFCSDRSIKISSPEGELIQIRYKVCDELSICFFKLIFPNSSFLALRF